MRSRRAGAAPAICRIENKRRAWQAFFAAYPGPVTYAIRDLTVTADGELAFVHSLNHVNGRLASGHVADLWVRWTACFQQIKGVWLVLHDHVSVPARSQTWSGRFESHALSSAR